MEIDAIIASVITIFAIMDPFASLSPFLAFTKNCKNAEAKKVATHAVVIAGAVAIVFLFAGPFILNTLSITLSDFKIAGGIVLVLLGIENTLNIQLTKENKKGSLDSIAVLIATPLLTGPGLMTTLIILDKENGVVPVVIALVISLILSLVILMNATNVRDRLGSRVIVIFSKVMGLFLIALGIAFIRTGILNG
jgi:multiple antibiotic resistance protein